MTILNILDESVSKLPLLNLNVNNFLLHENDSNFFGEKCQ